MKHEALSARARRTAAPPISWLMAAALARPQLISLAAGFTDHETLPVAEARRLLAGLLRSPDSGRPALQYGTTVGDPALRQWIAEDLARRDRLDLARTCPPERLVVTHGSQQLLYITAEALCDPGDLVLVEDPTYFVFLGIVQSHGLHARAVRLERDGLDLADLERVLDRLQRSGELRRLKLLYLVSYHQNPTGATTRFAKKCGALALLRRYERAAGHPLYLFEDSAYRELGFAGGEEPSCLAAPGHANRVIYAGTFSKPFATGVRVGYGLLPAALHAAVVRIKGNHDFGTSNLLQQLVRRAVQTGACARHVATLRRRYAHKARVMLEAMRAHFPPGVEYWEPRGGLYIWTRLPPGVKTGMKSAFFRAALRHEVLYVPGLLCYADDPSRRKPDHELRLSFGAASDDHIRAGIARLGEVMRECVGRLDP